VILLDRRESKLQEYMPKTVVTELEFGDVAIMGNGPDGPVTVGIERKRIRDLVNSIASGRLVGHQIPGMMKDYHKSYLLIEGQFRAHRITKEIETLAGRVWKEASMGKNKIRWRDLWMFLNSLSVMTGVVVYHCMGMKETVDLITTLDEWWSKDWDKHKGHLAMYKTTQTGPYMSLRKPTLLRRMASELPGIGFGRSKAVEELFKTVPAMLSATEEEWLEVEGIGKVTAKLCWDALHK
jgi:ERCC4-type nuclease